MSPSPERTEVVVVGSINADLVVRTPTLPRPGETVTGTSRANHHGGKGANQAVALARLERSVAFVGAVGDDPEGAALVTSLRSEGISTEGIRTSQEPTGLAVVLVDDQGENSIVGVLGANGDLATEDISANVQTILDADVVLAQLEIPLDVAEAAIATATGIAVLNPAPAQPLPPDLLAMVDYLIPNRTELGTLAGLPTPVTEAEILAATDALGFGGTTVVTLGADGAMAITDGVVVGRARPPKVDVVDTVGAGDAFCAGFVDALVREKPIDDAVAWAVVCGALATTVNGAQPSMPRRNHVEELASASSA